VLQPAVRLATEKSPVLRTPRYDLDVNVAGLVEVFGMDEDVLKVAPSRLGFGCADVRGVLDADHLCGTGGIRQGMRPPPHARYSPGWALSSKRHHLMFAAILPYH
jgi:hypothetical protein